MNRICLVFLAVSVLALSACASSVTNPIEPEGVPTSHVAPDENASECTSISDAALNAVNETVTGSGEGNSLPGAVALRDQKSGLWLVAGAFAGPAGQGEGALGIWATDGDVTSSAFQGTIWAVDGGAHQFSTAMYPSAVISDPENVPVLGCWSRNH